jgi:chromate reductase
MTSPVNILGISGSLRAASYNTALLRAAGELLPENVTLEYFDLHGLPMYDDDLLQKRIFPEPVQALRQAIASADALLFSTPEYNYSISGVLKNAIDWASRAPQSPLIEKPIAMMGASQGPFGTVRAQTHLRQILVITNSYVLNQPQVLVMNAATKFDPQGRLIDDTARQLIADQLAALAAWTRRLRGEGR